MALPREQSLPSCLFWSYRQIHAQRFLYILPGTHLYTWVESSNVDKVSCWMTKVPGIDWNQKCQELTGIKPATLWSRGQLQAHQSAMFSFSDHEGYATDEWRRRELENLGPNLAHSSLVNQKRLVMYIVHYVHWTEVVFGTGTVKLVIHAIVACAMVHQVSNTSTWMEDVRAVLAFILDNCSRV